MSREFLAERWADVGGKIVRLATELPEEKYEFRPAPPARSFAEQLRHVAFWNQYVRDAVGGATPDGSANELPRSRYTTKESIVRVLQESVDEARAAIAAAGSGKRAASGTAAEKLIQQVEPFIEHNAEHYGQLVVYFRLNGLVPPASRGDA